MTGGRNHQRTQVQDALEAPSGISGLYLHIPFCAKRCRYCDFATAAVLPGDPLIGEYVQALQLHLRRFARAGFLGNLASIYIGGGTPSFIEHRLVDLVYLLSMSVDHIDDTEFCVEANPDSFDERLFKDLRALGVNRYSLGVQSLDDAVLRTLGRIHDAKAALHAMDILDAQGANYSIDLMCGIPGQGMASWERTLDVALEHRLQHISVYPLSVEPRTALAQAIAQGHMHLPDEDLAADQMEYAAERLADVGFIRYEVASYARPGYESRHNTGYWTGGQYLGLGAGAASAVYADTCSALVDAGLLEVEDADENDIRAGDGRSPYLCRLSAPDDPRIFAHADKLEVSIEFLSKHQAACERAMLMMRMSKGISREELEGFEGHVPGLIGVLDSLVRDGLVASKGGRYRPTARGWIMGNLLFGRIWDLAGGI